ncbi:histidine phosphatase family protein, partial [Oscillospiraceae bacterium OttesenSCG-928-G22]|nr:histidine phosphatase family protein [Oscillospiraceae bacterium OttesenSCG-928-G22]
MTTLFIVRHTEAEGNLYRRCHGRFDGLVTPNGRQQIAALRERMLREEIDVVYASDLTRACETARAIAEPKGLSIEKTAGLREMDLGDWEDLPWADIASGWPEENRLFFERAPDFRAPGGESFDDLRRRISGVVLDILKKHEGKRVCVVSHAIAIRQLLMSFDEQMGRPPEEYGLVDNTSVTRYEVSGDSFSCIYRNDNLHKADIKTPFPVVPDGFEETRGYLHFRPAAYPADEAFIESCWRDSLTALYGPNGKFDLSGLLADTRRMHRAHRESVRVVMLGDTPAGLLVYDTYNLTEPDCGHITLFYLAPAFRGYRLSLQLLGDAVSYYRALDRKFLSLRVSEK